MNRLVIGTRGSLLARWQSAYVASTLRTAYPGLVIEERIIVTSGDRLSSGPLWNAGGKGVWVKEIEEALLASEIDLAVHSMKDVPGEVADGLALVAVPPRADARDALVSRTEQGLNELPRAVRLGTNSLRRACQLKAMRPDMEIEVLRGNLDTRLRKIEEGVVDAAVLACAGLDRLGFAGRITERLSIDQMLPAVGQGALAIEARADDTRVRELCRVLDHRETATTILAERELLARLGASCRTPVAGHAELAGDQLTLRGLVGKVDGTAILAGEMSAPAEQAAELGRALADDLLARGAAAMLDGVGYPDPVTR